jgi:hypothetical protein
MGQLATAKALSWWNAPGGQAATVRHGTDVGALDKCGLFFQEPTRVFGDGLRASIYVGSAYNAGNPDTFETYRIRRVLNVTVDVPIFFEGRATYLRVPLEDTAEQALLHRDVRASVDFVRAGVDRGQNVLIHCFLGRSRSVAIAAHVVEALGGDPREVLRLDRASVNVNFVEGITNVSAPAQ